MSFGWPAAADLLDAVRQHLREEVRPALSGKAAYDVRVASNLLSIMQRELELGPAVAERARQRLTALLGIEAGLDELNTALSHRIRNREIESTHDELLGHLRQTAVDKLSIDNPKYSAYLRATQDRQAT